MTKKIYKQMSLILCVLMVFSTFVPVFGAGAASSDYESHWAKDAIQSAMNQGIVTGYPDGTFRPDNEVTRAEFFLMVNNAFKFTTKAEITYNDIEIGAWYYGAISNAKAAGYITGYEDGRIRPEGNVARQEAAVIIQKVKKLTSDDASAATFADTADMANWAKGAIGAVVKAGIMKGYPENTFLPERVLTRAEAVTILLAGLTIGMETPEVPLGAPVVIPQKSTGGGSSGGSSGGNNGNNPVVVNNATFSGALSHNYLLALTGVTNVADNSKFDITKFTYSNGDKEYKLAGVYSQVASEGELNQGGVYYFSGSEGKLIIALDKMDYMNIMDGPSVPTASSNASVDKLSVAAQGIVLSDQSASVSNEKLSAAAGWNTSTIGEAKAVTGISIGEAAWVTSALPELLSESSNNDGSLADGTVTLNITNGTIADDILKTDVTASNLPAGLDFSIEKTGGQSLEIHIAGIALAHADANDVNNLMFSIDRKKVNGSILNLGTDFIGINFIDTVPDEQNEATFTGASVDGTNLFYLTLTGVTGVEDGSTFDLTKLTYSDGEATPQTYTLQGPYIQVDAPYILSDWGKYYYSAADGKLFINTTQADCVAINLLVGNVFGGAGLQPDQMSAAEGWNMNLASIPAASVSGVDINYAKYPVTFTVTNGATPIVGANISIAGETLTTDQLGIASIELGNGYYQYGVTATGYDAISEANVTVADAPIAKAVIMTAEVPSYAVTFTVTDGTTPIAGANISIANETLITDETGIASVNLRSGDYAYCITKAGFVSISEQSVNVASVPVSVDVEMVAEVPEYLVTFTVTDGTDAIEGANITIDGQTLTTNENGIASIDLENGDYEYGVTAEGYESMVEQSVTVAGASVQVNVSLAAEVPEYLVTFTVVDSTDAIIEGASITIDGQTLTTNENGIASINLENGDYEYGVTAEGYESMVEQSVTVADAAVAETVTMTVETPVNNATFTGASTDVAFYDLTLTGVEGVESGSTFDINKLTYSNGEQTPQTYTLKGAYTKVATMFTPGQSTVGQYYYDSVAGELHINLTDDDYYNGVYILTGLFGDVLDQITAAEGWNVTAGGVSASQVDDIDVELQTPPPSPAPLSTQAAERGNGQ